MRRALAVVMFLSALAGGRTVAGAQDAEAWRGVHVRGHLAGHAAVAIPFGASGMLLGGGVSSGVEVALHPNHDLGVRGFATWLPHDTIAAREWQDHTALQLALLYRFHDDVVVQRWAPYLEVGFGIGGYDGCLNGDSCGGFGPAAVLGGGVELALHRYFAVAIGVQALGQFGMANGVGMLLLPELTLALRGG